MDFNNNKPIYKQIVEYCYRNIMSGNWTADGRVPSTKDLSVELAVNNRTVLKAFEELSDSGVIFQKRGLGFFVSSDAKDLIVAARRKEFMETTLPEFVAQMQLLGLKSGDIEPYLPQ